MYNEDELLRNRAHPMAGCPVQGLYQVALVCYAARAFGADPNWFRVGVYANAAGVGLCVVAAAICAVPGLADRWGGVPRGTTAKLTSPRDMLLVVAALAVFAVNALLQWGQRDSPAPDASWAVALAAVGIAFTTANACLDGIQRAQARNGRDAACSTELRLHVRSKSSRWEGDRDYELRFDKAEFIQTGVAPAPGSPAESLPDSQAQPTCCACQLPITGIYYTSAADLICSSCREQYRAHQAAGSRFGRFFRAVVHGLAAGMAGALIWFAVRKLTGYEIGLIAIVLGYMVGAAVRVGSRARGGLGYQLLAVFLTYACIALNYMPDVYTELREEFGEIQPTEETTRSAIPAAPTTPPAPTTEEVAAAPAATDTGPDDRPDLPEPVRLLLMAALVFGVAFVGTALVGFEQPILLLILGFALWQAWKLNRHMPVQFAGPFALGQLSSGPGAPSDPVGAP